MLLKCRYLAIVLSFISCAVIAQSAPTGPVNAVGMSKAPTPPPATTTSPVAQTTPPVAPVAPAPTTAPAPAAPTPTVTPPPATPTTPAAAPVTTDASGKQSSIILCPPIEKLIKKELFWGAPGGWRSYSQSFVNVIDTFVGAQWVGVEVGKMLCVYKGKESFDFPVVLEKTDTLTPAPTGAKWIRQKGGYVNCLSNQPENCPFFIEVKKENMEEIYKDIDFYKDKSKSQEP